jgi:RNA polymerase sigma-70 factor (ECF subfamily)
VEAARVKESERSEPGVSEPGVSEPGVSEAGFDEFFRAEYRRVVGLASVLCGRSGIAEELAQDAFVAAYRHWDRVARYDDPAAWVRRVVVNLATSALRRRTREARALTRLALRRAGEPTVSLDVDDDFWRAVRELPRRQAQCVALRYLEDRSPDEIAAILGIAPPTVRVHLHAARSTLAQRLGEALDDEETQ